MMRALPRTHFSRSSLIRHLAPLVPEADGQQAPKADLAERLGQWLHVADAIDLFSALAPATLAVVPATATQGVADEVAQVRDQLTRIIVRRCAATDAAGRSGFPLPAADMPPDVAASYVPFHRFHLAQQREMATQLEPLRQCVRDALAHAAPALRQLGDIDAVFERALAARATGLLARVPALLEQRFDALLAAHRQAHVEGADDIAAWLRPGGWLDRFRDDMKRALLAELDLRLQPILGLLAALDRNTTST